MSTDTRIESLETKVRTLKRMLFGVFGLVVVTALAGCPTSQSVPDVIRAKRFEVVKGGKPVAEIFADGGGGVLRIANNDGQTVAEIASANIGGVLFIRNKDGNAVVHISRTADGGGRIETLDSKGTVTSETP